MLPSIRRTTAATLLALSLAGVAAATSAQSPAASVVPSTAASPAAISGPVFPGTLIQAIPPLVNGVAVTVSGPVEVDPSDPSLGADIGGVLEAVGATQVEGAFGSNDALIIVGFRVPGVDSAAMDAALVTTIAANASYSGVRVEPIAGRAVHAFDGLAGTQYAWVNGELLFWILGPDGAAQQAVAAMPGSSVPLVPGGAAPSTTTVELTIGSGPDAGTYQGLADTGGCTTDALGDDQYGLQYSTTDPAVVFSSLQVVIEEGKAATGKKGSSDILVTATVNGTTYRLDPDAKDGKGTARVTVETAGPFKATYRIKGTTKDKTPIEAVVSCATVLDFGG